MKKIKLRRDMWIGAVEHLSGTEVVVSDLIGENLVRIGKADLVEDIPEPEAVSDPLPVKPSKKEQ